METTKSSLALDDQLRWLGFHGITKIRIPSMGRKGFARLDIGQNAKFSINLMMTRLELNGNMNNGTFSVASSHQDFLGILNGAVLVYGILDGLVQFASRRCELILELDKDKGSV